MIVSGCLLATIPVFLPETRSAVILGRRAAKLQKENPGILYRAQGDERAPFRVLIQKSLWRPLCASKLWMNSQLLKRTKKCA
jgi:hypothetical protein